MSECTGRSGLSRPVAIFLRAMECQPRMMVRRGNADDVVNAKVTVQVGVGRSGVLQRRL